MKQQVGKLFILILLWVYSQTGYSQLIDSINVYYMPFQIHTRYGYWEDDLIGKRTKISLKDLSSTRHVKKVKERLSFIKSNSIPLEKQGRDLRMVCVFYYTDQSEDIIGFSYLKHMSVNGILHHRDDYFLKLILKLVGDKYLSKTVKPWLKE